MAAAAAAQLLRHCVTETTPEEIKKCALINIHISRDHNLCTRSSKYSINHCSSIALPYSFQVSHVKIKNKNKKQNYFFNLIN